MNKAATLNPPNIYVKEVSPQIGRGVFARQAFKKGELIEVAPVIIFTEPFADLPAQLKTRVFNWGHLSKSHSGTALALGYGSFYNHCDTPNLAYTVDNNSPALLYFAISDIAADEQLTIHYDQADGIHREIDKSWFENQHVDQI